MSANRQSVEQLVDQAIVFHKDGLLDQAAGLYDQALVLDNNHPDALHLRGVIAYQQDDPELAKQLIERAIDIDPLAAEFHHNLGEVFRAQPQMKEAISAYQAALAIEPERVDSLRSLGIAAQNARDFDLALEAWDRALKLDPQNAETLNNRGVTLRHLNRADDAMLAFQCALELKPSFFEALDNLLATLNQVGRHEEAIRVAQMIVDSRPNEAAPLVSLGSAMIDGGKPSESLTPLYHALKIAPEFANAHLVLSFAFVALRELKGAHLALQKVVEIAPKYLPGYIQLSHVLLQRGEAKAAIAAAQAGIDRFPKSWDLHINLSSSLYHANFFPEAADVAAKAVELQPQRHMSHSLYATVLTRLNRYEEAEKSFLKALEISPSDLGTLGNYSTMLALKGDLKTAIESFRVARRMGSQNADLHSNMLLYLNGLPGLTPQEIFEEHRRWGELHGSGLAPQTPKFNVSRDLERPLRVGYLSADWRFHSVAYFITPLIAAHHRDRVVPVIYDNVAQPDLMTKHIRSLVDEWHRVTGLSDDQLVNKIREDRIDILVDLSGHTSGHRLGVFSRRAAPIQVNYLGYPNTTGLPEMDYRITDEIADPPALSDEFHTEKLARVEPPFICYRPSDDAPDVNELPALTNGYVTFCSFNAISKFNAAASATWSRVLMELPDSKLLIKAPGLQEAETRRRIVSDFEQNGVDASRIEMLPRTPTYNEHMGTYGLCDLALDTFPYNGTTTTCEAFWMGVPVVTGNGLTHASRVSTTLLKSLGLDELVSNDDDEFVRIAVRFAKDLPRLDQIRRTLRQRMLESTLMDAPRKATSIESAYRKMWMDWCSKAQAVIA